jgi:multidrug efflux pump subunit AcrA (membrane-fusion protein)
VAKTLPVVLVVFAIAGCGKEGRSKNAEDIPTVRTETVAREDLVETIDYVGTIRARDEAIVYPRVTGKIVAKLKNEGEPVLKGETIALIDRDEVGFTFETAPVESPLSGVIGRIPVDLGTSVTTQTPIATVVDLSEAEIRLDVPEKYLPLLHPGLKSRISVDAYPGETFPGEVSQVSPVLDIETRTAPAEIVIPNADHRLKPGMFARVKIAARTFSGVPTISQEALVGREPDAAVFVVEGDTARVRKVVPGFKQGSRLQIAKGLNGGEMVIVMGQQRLKDGDRVRVEGDAGEPKLQNEK